MKQKIIINQGDLSCESGEDLDLYLMEWQQERGIPDGAHVRVITEDALQLLLAASDCA